MAFNRFFQFLRSNGRTASTWGLPSRSGAHFGATIHVRRLSGKLCLRLDTAGSACRMSPMAPNLMAAMLKDGGEALTLIQFISPPQKPVGPTHTARIVRTGAGQRLHLLQDGLRR